MYNYSPCNYCYRHPHYIKAYPIDIPVYVNGENINKPPYKALNYHPDGAKPAVYVPVYQFTKVGATVNWDAQTQSIDVSTDETIEDKLTSLKAWRMAYGEISRAVETPAQHKKMRFNGMIDGDKVVFDGIWWHASEGADANLTVGKYYDAHAEAGGMSKIYLTVINDLGRENYFFRSVFSFEAEGIPHP